MRSRHSTLLLIAPLLAACAATSPERPQSDRPSATNPPASAATWFDALRAHCGKAYAGRIAIDTPTPAQSAFSGKTLVMHVRECGEDAIRVPFHVGDDRSRTWVLTRTASGSRLKHDHRHEDGTPDKVTMYGGDSVAVRAQPDGGLRVEFPVDDESVSNFTANGLTASVRNTWAMELNATRFVYELSRPDGRLFRVEFDLTVPVSAPPPPWGAVPPQAADGR